ncbi:recombinase family protein [Micromonospora sp. DT62]|uniref:recombinase family protein n=1 Tax=Micromonospora sp. DT62 TaxID=3416521 RepID=UPI003CEBFD2A
MRVLGARRLSRGDDESTSEERQGESITTWAKLHGHTVIGWADDIDVSGSVDPWDRPGLGPWLRGERLPFDIIVGAKVDRLSRKLLHFVKLVDWADENGKAIASATEPINTGDKYGRIIANILAMFAEFEREAIRERNQGSQELAREEGRWHGGTPPYGYKPEKQPKGEGWRLTVDPESSEHVKYIVKRLLNGDSLNSIATDLNNAGVLAPSDHHRRSVGRKTLGYRWKTTSLSPILRSRTILGIAEQGGEVVRGANGMPVKRAEEIISRADWERVQKRLDEISRKKTRSVATSPLLGVVFCIECGEPLYRLVTGPAAKQNRREYYRCRGRAEKRNQCEVTSVRADALEEAIELAMLSHIGDLEMHEEVFIPGESHQQELAEATEALDDLLKKSAGKSAAVQKVYAKQITSLETLIDRLSEMPESPDRTELRSTGQTYREVWDAADALGRRKLLLKAGVRVEAARASKDGAVTIGRFERPERLDEAVELGVHQGIRYAFYVPKNLIGRATR